MQHFRVSFLVTAILMAVAAWWGYTLAGLQGALQSMFIAVVLGIMEVSLSFDNAVVNAAMLRNWSDFWKNLFLTVGILVAVFAMRLLFPLLIVAVATGMGLFDVWHLAIDTPLEYSRRLNAHHAEVAAFGGTFLLLVFLHFLFNDKRELHWLGAIEKKLGDYGTDGLAIFVTLLAAFACVGMAPDASKLAVLMAGVLGVVVYVGVGFINSLLEDKEIDPQFGKAIQRGSLGGFLYLEILDASFSFDGVIGAFAITSDVVIIMLGLGIGAMYVRSMTVYLVEKGTLEHYVYLEHGAHYAIGILALIMLAGVKYSIPEWITGLSGVAFIVLSLFSSIRYRRRKFMERYRA